MQTLRILLLQPPAIFWGESRVQLQRRASRNLFFYLACQLESTRSSLCTLFWPDLLEEESRPLLRSTLSKLRTALPDPDVLVASEERVWLDRDRIWVDVQDFLALVKPTLHTALQIPNYLPLPEAVAQPLRRAANLWSTNELWPGADFMDQPELETWLRNLRLDVEYSYQRVLERLAYNAAANGDLELALTRARRALQIDTLNDEMHANVLQWLLALGQRSKAVEYCQVISSNFRRDDTPIPEHLSKLCATARNTSTQSPSVTNTPWPRSMFTTLPYIHRPEPEQLLKQAYQRGGKLLVEGEAGIGKTRLLFEFFRAQEPTPRLLLVTGQPNEHNLPYQALINTLRHQVFQEDWQQLAPVWVAQLAQLLPELLILRPDIQEAAQQTEGEAALYEALHQLFLVMAQTGKFLLILDDAHRIDQASLNALSFLCNCRFFNQTRLLVTAYRPEEETPALKQFTVAALPDMLRHHVRLVRFTASEISQLTHLILGQTPSPETTLLLMRETGGNPLFLLESLYLLLNYSPLDINQIGTRLPLSANLHALVQARLQRLSPTSYQVIGAAAVIGEEFSLTMLESCCNLLPEQVVLAVEELEQTRLIQPANKPPHTQTYTFVYSKIREVLLVEMGAARQRMLHLRIARILESSQQPAPGALASILAGHYENAGEPLKAMEHWVNAGRHALHLFSPIGALAAFERAENLLAQLGTAVPDETVYHLYKEWNYALSASGQSTRLREISLQFWDTGEKRFNPLLCGAALNGLARAALLDNQVNLCLQYCDRADAYLQQVDSPLERIKSNNIRGDCQILFNQTQAAIETFTQVIAQCEKNADTNLLDEQAHAEYSIAEAQFFMGWPSLAIDMALRCIHTSLKAKNASWSMKAHMVLVFSEYYLGNMIEALDHARQGTELAEALQSWRNVAYIKIAQTRSELAQGWLDASWQHNQQAEEVGRQESLPRVLSWTASHHAQTLRFLRQFALATETYQQGLAHSVFALDRLECQFRLGLSLLGEGKIKESIHLQRDCLSQSERGNLGLIAMLAETALLYSLAQTGELDEVRHRLPGFIQRAAEHQIAEVIIGAEAIQSLLAEKEGRLADALHHIRRGIEYSVKYRIIWWEIHFWLHLFKLGDDRKAAQERISQITQIILDHGMVVPELAPYVRSFVGEVKSEVGYT